MKVAYVTPYYNGRCDGRLGRFHDWVHTARDMDNPPFDFDVLALMTSNPDETITTPGKSFFGEATDLWGTKLNKLEIVLNIPRLRRELQNTEYDIVHVLRLEGLIYPTVVNTVDSETPLVLGPNIGGWAPIRTGSQWEVDNLFSKIKRLLGYRYRRALGKHAHYDMAMGFTEYHQEILKQYGLNPHKIQIIQPGVHRRFAMTDEQAVESHSSNEVPHILYVGDLTKHKGYYVFLRALEKLEFEFHALVAGIGTPNDDLVRSLNIDNNITHLGFVDRANLPQYYAKADLFVMPSIDEMGGTNTIIEALASGTPIVATDRTGINEIPPDDATEFFSPRTPEALASAIQRAFDQDLKDVAEKNAQKFLAKRAISQLAELYRSLSNGYGDRK